MKVIFSRIFMTNRLINRTIINVKLVYKNDSTTKEKFFEFNLNILRVYDDEVCL